MNTPAKTHVKVDSEFFEAVKAEFLNEDYIREPEFPIKRFNKPAGRYYVKIVDDKTLVYGAGVTSILFAQMPLSPYLLEWQRDISAKYGADYYKWFMDQSAGYGTYLHVLFGRLLHGEEFPLDKDSLLVDLQLFCADKQRYEYYEIKKWYISQKRNIEKDVLCFIKFCQDYKVTPIAIEYPFVYKATEKNDDLYNFSGTIDFVVEISLKDKNGDEYREIVIVDFKSGLKGFYDSHVIQLHPYRIAWNCEHPDLPVKQVFNFSPKNFREKTGIKYNFENQTNKTDITWKWNYYIDMFYREHKSNPLDKQMIIAKNLEASLEMDLSEAIIEHDPVKELLTK